MNSIGPDCNELKKTYDTCFQNWFKNHFLKGETDDSMCQEQFQQYNECIRKAMKNQRIDMELLNHEVLNTPEEQKEEMMNLRSRLISQFSFVCKAVQPKLKLAVSDKFLFSCSGNNVSGSIPKVTLTNQAADFTESSKWFFSKLPICYQLCPKTFPDIIYKNPYPFGSKIIEPDLEKKIKIEMPLLNILNKNMELPCSIRTDKTDPLKSSRIYAKANMLIIRRRKMRKHKWRKLQKRMKFQFAKVRRQRELKKEMIFQAGLKEILAEGENFSAEDYLKNKLEVLNWVPPVTKARGRLAPLWVIENELENKRVQKLYDDRIAECIKKNKILE